MSTIVTGMPMITIRNAPIWLSETLPERPAR